MLGERLKHVRTYYGDRQSDLARRLNVSLSTIKSWEGGHSSPNYQMLVRICRIYQVTSDFLIGVTDDDPLADKKAQDNLTSKSRSLVRLFEEFMLYKQQKETKK